jgi:hypothetical protein
LVAIDECKIGYQISKKVKGNFAIGEAIPVAIIPMALKFSWMQLLLIILLQIRNIVDIIPHLKIGDIFSEDIVRNFMHH